MSTDMLELLQKTHDKAEELKGRRLYIFLATSFLAFVAIGIVSGYFISFILNKNEISPISQNTVQIKAGGSASYDGRIKYVDPNLYPNDMISYVLVDQAGGQIILLKAADQKLAVAEGHAVSVVGKVGKTLDGKEQVLTVDKVLISNGAN